MKGAYVHGYGSIVNVLWELRGEHIQTLLPPWLQLEPIPHLPEDRHLIVFTFARETDVHGHAGPLRSNGFTFQEIGMGIPHVSKQRSGRRYYAIPKVYLNNVVAYALGRYFWSFEKRWAKIEHQSKGLREGIFSVFSEGQFVTSMIYEKVGERGRKEAFPHLEQLIADQIMTALPVLDRTWFGMDLCTQFTFDWERTWVYPVEIKMHLSQLMFPYAPELSLEAKGIHEVPRGAFLLEGPWTMGLPGRCV